MMERLSEKLTDVLRECIDALSQVEEDIIKMALNRLAAYEDTGLEPNDIKAMYTSIEKIGLPLWKLEELAGERKDGEG
jgi:hypothetical protein